MNGGRRKSILNIEERVSVFMVKLCGCLLIDLRMGVEKR